MKNIEIARILREIGILLRMEDVEYKARAYERASRSIESMEEDVEEVYRRGGIKALMEIPGVGESIARKIEELIGTGRLEYYEELRRKTPVNLEELYGIQGLGPKRIKVLWQRLKIRDLDDLEKAALAHKLHNIPGFQEKTEQRILKGIALAKRSRNRRILGFVLPYSRDLERRLRSLPHVMRAVVTGSVRRMKETIGDLDFVVVTSGNSQQFVDSFVSMPDVEYFISGGSSRASVRLRMGLNADLRIIGEESFGAALQDFTGSKDHTLALREIARRKGWKLNEYGLFERARKIAGKYEEEVYERLGLEWIPPELRENRGEIEAAAARKLPKLIGYDELKGDTQVHTDWTDGSNSIREMAEEAKRRGLKYIVISNHSKSLPATGGLDEQGLMEQAKEIDALNEEIEGIRILKGVELNILKDGGVDISNDVLEQLDVVGAAVHSHFDLTKEEMTRRVLKAMEDPNIDIIYHPTSRLIQRREPIRLDMEKVIEEAKDLGKILDIDSYPDRMDLSDEFIRKAVEVGAKLCISSDSHSIVHFHNLELGTAQARRGWATAEDIVNTKSEFVR